MDQLQPILTALVFFTIFLIITLFANPILNFLLVFDPTPDTERDQFPIEYPEAPMCDSFHDTLHEIQSCSTRKDIKRAYERIVIFEGSYKNAGKYVHELWLHYNEKESSIMSSLN